MKINRSGLPLSVVMSIAIDTPLHRPQMLTMDEVSVAVPTTVDRPELVPQPLFYHNSAHDRVLKVHGCS